MEQNEEFLDYIKDEGELIINMFFYNKLKNYFAKIFEDVRHERSLILSISLRDSDILKQSKFSDQEINKIRKPSSTDFS